jgi:acyl-CoA thioesterase I
MKKIAKIVGVMILLGVSGYFLFQEKPAVKNTPPKNDKIVVFGDSLAQGVGATKGNDLASLIGKTTGKTMFNYGTSGDTTRDALEHIFAALGDDPGTAIIILGGNDVLKKIPQEETFQNLEKIIKLFQDNGAAVVLVGVRSGLVGDGRGDDYEALAQKTQSVYVSDILQDVFGKKQYMSDAIHPNDTGYALIEKRLSPNIKKLFETN